MNRDELIAHIRARMQTTYPGYQLPKACLHWADTTVKVLRNAGYNAQIQAGTLCWPRIKPEEDDGVILTHFSYVWEDPENIMECAIRTFRYGHMPEIHCWAALVDPPTLIDLTTGFLPQQCLSMTGLAWTAPDPPDHLWATVDEIPDGVVYIPNWTAINFAHILLKKHHE